MNGKIMGRALFLTACLGAGLADAATVRPRTTNEALINPGMGFCHYAYAGRLWAYGSQTENCDTLEWFPGCSTTYMRVLWSDLEPAEGDYRWDILDRIAQPWIAKGKKIAIRVICCNQTENATPDFVRDAGAKGHLFEYVIRKEPRVAVERWEPTYDDPVFLEKFGNFLKAFAARYDGDPSVAFVDVGSFGIFGEGHSQFLGELRERDGDEFNRLAAIHLELWRKHLPRTTLVVSDDIGGSWNQAPDHPLMAKARSLGIGYRDDSIFCAPPPDQWKHPHWARKSADVAPVVVEAGHYSILSQDGRWHPEMLLRCVEELRASYFSIHGFPRPILEAHRAEISAMNLRLGYRFALREATWPDVVTVDEPVCVTSTWVNAGVAVCLAGASLTWSLADDAGNVRWSATDTSFDFRSLKPTLGGVESPVTVTSRVRFGHTVRNPSPDCVIDWARGKGWEPGEWNVMLPAGTYDLCVSAGSRQGTPTIALPLETSRSDRRYCLGRMTVRDKAR